MSVIQVRTKENYIRFKCLVCSANSLCDIRYMSIPTSMPTQTHMLVCRACGQGSVWKMFDRKDNYNYNLRLVDPILSDAPPAAADMPEDVKADYEDARLVVNHSTRAAAALLRLALQKLCRHLGEPGEHIDTDYVH